MRLEEVLAMVLELDASAFSDDTGRDAVEAWDSLGHLNVMSAIEETYTVTFSTAEMREAQTVGDLKALVRAKGGIP